MIYYKIKNSKYLRTVTCQELKDLLDNNYIISLLPNMIDLHTHTINSDGTWTTKELLTKAEKLGLEVLSITDHDTAKSHIEGVEVYHSSFTEEQIEILKDYCTNKGLLVSGGSDCHGEKKKERKLGLGYGNLNIDKQIIENWNIN